MNRRLLAAACWAAGLLLNPWLLGWLLAPDGHIGDAKHLAGIAALQSALLVLGWVLFSRNLPRGARLVVHAAGLVLILSVVGIALGSKEADPVAPVKVAKLAKVPKPPPPPTDFSNFLWELTDVCNWLKESAEVHVGNKAIPKVQADLAQARATGDPQQILKEQKALGLLYLGHSQPDEAIAEFESALELANESKQGPKRISDLEFQLGLSYLRRGEVSHCIQHHNPERCLFPIQASGVWTDTSGALTAIDHFLASYRLDPTNTGARWLMTVAWQAAGSDARGVPPELLIQPTPHDPDSDVVKFPDIAKPLGVDTFNGAGGAVLDDIDGDGWLDIVTSSIFPCQPLHFFHNQGDGTFADWSERSGLSKQMGGLSLFQADYDNDGDLDLFVPRGAWMSDEYGKQRRSLIRQDPGCVFVDATRESGLGERTYPCQAAVWGDYDNDGDLDLFIGNERHPCELYRNRGNGTFEDVTELAGVANGGMTKGCAFGDYDNDGDLDLYVSNLGQPNLFYENDGDGTFHDIARELAVAVPVVQDAPKGDNRTFNTWFWDYDNDGWLDLFVAGFSGSLTDWANDYIGQPAVGGRLRLYHNDGHGGFREVAREAGIHRICLPMGANLCDIDNDGFLDFYLGTGKPDFEFLVPNLLFRNVGGKRFADVTTDAGVGHLQKGHGVAFGDVDNDGDQDLLAEMGAFYLADAFHNAFFENPGNDNHWITIVLRGVRSNRFGFGSRLRLDVTGPEGPRRIEALAGPGGSFGGSSLQQEIGLGQAEKIARLEITWPASRTVQVFENLETDQFVQVTEGDQNLVKLDRPRIRLAANQ